MKNHENIIKFMNKIADELNSSKILESNYNENVAMHFSITVSSNDVGSGNLDQINYYIEKDFVSQKYFLNVCEDKRMIKRY